MWNNLEDDDYQQTSRWKQIVEFDRCCLCIKIPVGVKVLAVIDLVIFSFFTYRLTTIPARDMMFFMVYCLAILLPACAGFSLLLITG